MSVHATTLTTERADASTMAECGLVRSPASAKPLPSTPTSSHAGSRAKLCPGQPGTYSRTPTPNGCGSAGRRSLRRRLRSTDTCGTHTSRGPGFYAHRLTDLVSDPMLIKELTAGMKERGVGPSSQRKTLVVLSAVLTAAVEWKKIPTNPVWRMRKPPGTRQRHPIPLRRWSSNASNSDCRGARPGQAVPFEAAAMPVSSACSATPVFAQGRLWPSRGKTSASGPSRSTRPSPTASSDRRRQVNHGRCPWSSRCARNSRSGRPSREQAGGLVFPGPEGGSWSRSQANKLAGPGLEAGPGEPGHGDRPGSPRQGQSRMTAGGHS